MTGYARAAAVAEERQRFRETWARESLTIASLADEIAEQARALQRPGQGGDWLANLQDPTDEGEP
jgi:hypothetical protein